MAYHDLDPLSKLRLGKAAQWVGIASILLGIIGGVLVALMPTEGTRATPEQNVLFGIFCCFGPSLFAAIPILIVGRMLRKSARGNDIGSLYRGWD